jgi:hypothetical protein
MRRSAGERLRKPVLAFLDHNLSDVCSSSCKCVGLASAALEALQSYFDTNADFIQETSSMVQPSVLIARLTFELLPTLAARLFDPAGGHKLVAVQNALMKFKQRVCWCRIPYVTSSDSISCLAVPKEH